MEWYNFLAAFFSGAFLANAVPHFVQGVSGNKFPTPFAKPPGKGLSSAHVNVLWGSLNILIGYVLLKPGKLQTDNYVIMLVFFAGIVLMSFSLSKHSQKRTKNKNTLC